MFIDYVQMEFIHPFLIKVLKDIENEFGQKVFTSLYRHNDPGVHGTIPTRGADIGEKNQIVGNVIKGWVNSRWIYDSERPNLKVCVFGDENHKDHIHVQVHKNTKGR